jgi:thymidylate kinase
VSEADRPLALSVARLVDSIAGGRVIVLGSPPPQGRDLDLLVRAGERRSIERGLLAAGLVRRGETFARFADCSAYGVELIAAERYLSPGPLGELFRGARPVEGFSHLCRPAPPHALLVLARLVADEGRLVPKRHRRLERILAGASDVWSEAEKFAPGWGAETHLRRLAWLQQEPSRGQSRGPAGVAWGLRRAGSVVRRRPLLVSLSGLDGSGKSSQARWLVQSLHELGVPAEVVWNDLLGNVAADVVARPIKALLAMRGHALAELSSYEDRAAPVDSQTIAPAPSGAVAGERRDLAREAWSGYVTLTGALEQRWHAMRQQLRGRAVVFDRGPLDLAVRMQVLYRTSPARASRIAGRVAPRPRLSFWLDIPPALSLERKEDIWSLRQLTEQARMYGLLAAEFGVTRLDGTRPAAELAAEIGSAVWRALA